MSESAEAREWHRVIRASVRECLETWTLQAQAGPVTVDALETILARATIPILRRVEERPPEVVVALLPSLIRTMLAAFVEVMAEQSGTKMAVMLEERWQRLREETRLLRRFLTIYCN